jgi:CubicO group peptidase (beta-lactamase class C family)
LPCFRPFIAALAALPALAACSSHSEAPPPLSREALSAVTKNPGAPTDMLARQVDEVFSNKAVGETRALVVMHAGQIAAERYAPGYGPKTRFVSWSMAKTVTGVMIGMLVADGRLRLDQSPPVPRWQRSGDPRGEITLRARCGCCSSTVAMTWRTMPKASRSRRSRGQSSNIPATQA